MKTEDVVGIGIAALIILFLIFLTYRLRARYLGSSQKIVKYTGILRKMRTKQVALSTDCPKRYKNFASMIK